MTNPLSAPVICIILGRWVVPVHRDDTSRQSHSLSAAPVDMTDLIISHGAVAIRGNRIIGVGTALDIREQFKAHQTDVCDLSKNHIIIPGLINSHTHCAMSLLRGYADDFPLDVWLRKYVWPTEGKIMSDEYVYEGTAIAIVEGLKSGTTMMNDMYQLPAPALRAFQEGGVRCVMGSPLMDLGDGTMEKQFQDAMEFLRHHLETIEVKKQQDGANDDPDLFRPSFTPHAVYTVDKSFHRRAMQFIGTTLKHHHVVYHTHLHETVAERLCYEARTGETAIQTLYNAGALNERFVGAHCVHLADEEIDLLAKTKANVVHCPKSNLKLASGFCNVWRLMQSGINVCLGTDGGCTNNSLDMLSEMQFAALLAKAVSKDSAAVNAYTALTMATRNGAKALGRLDDLGSLEVGKLADVVAIDLVGADRIGHPIFDPISHLVYTTHRVVTDVWINGWRVMRDQQILSIQRDVHRMEHLVKKVSQIRADIFASNSIEPQKLSLSNLN